jgi:hypothetical protein
VQDAKLIATTAVIATVSDAAADGATRDLNQIFVMVSGPDPGPAET